jgi:hypothetical protein
MNLQACTRVVPSSSPSTSTPTTRTSPQRSSARRPYVFVQIRSRDGRPTGMSPSLQIYHPNVDLEGNVCLNILREDWKPVLNLNSVMVGLQYLFLEPNADDPLNKGTYHLSSIDGTRLTTVFIQRPQRSSARTVINSSRTSSPPWSAGTSRASSTTMSWHRPVASLFAPLLTPLHPFLAVLVRCSVAYICLSLSQAIRSDRFTGSRFRTTGIHLTFTMRNTKEKEAAQTWADEM